MPHTYHLGRYLRIISCFSSPWLRKNQYFSDFVALWSKNKLSAHVCSGTKFIMWMHLSQMNVFLHIWFRNTHALILWNWKNPHSESSVFSFFFYNRAISKYYNPPTDRTRDTKFARTLHRNSIFQTIHFSEKYWVFMITFLRSYVDMNSWFYCDFLYVSCLILSNKLLAHVCSGMKISMDMYYT